MSLRIVAASALVLAVTLGAVAAPVAAAPVVAELDEPAAVGSIAGTATEEGSGTPLAGIRVRAWSFQWGQPRIFAGHTRTAADGTYTIGNLPAGTYIVGFADVDGIAPELTTEYHSTDIADAAGFARAKQFPLASGQNLTGIDESLQPGSSIAGTLTDEATSAPLGGIRVRVWASDFNWDIGYLVGNTTTGPDGSYRISGLPARGYVVGFSDEDGIAPRYADEYHDNSPWRATRFMLGAAEDLTGVDAALQVGGSISGTVSRDGTGAPVADARVRVWFDRGGGYSPLLGTAFTDGAGAYTIDGLPPGDYIVHFSPSRWTGAGGEYYQDAGGPADYTLITVAAGAAITGIDASVTGP